MANTEFGTPLTALHWELAATVPSSWDIERELWRECPEDCNSPSIHVIGHGIGINVGGLLIVRTAREWHDLVARDLPKPERKV